MSAGVFLINPKYPHNVAGALRACAIFGAHRLNWTNERVQAPSMAKQRLPREERMKEYKRVAFVPAGIEHIAWAELTPVAVELRKEAEPLSTFEHPENAFYVFGPEDGTIPKKVLAMCHRFVRIDSPTRTPLNLACAVNVVLYDRFVKGAVR